MSGVILNAYTFFPVGLLTGDRCCSLGCSLVPLWTSQVALMVRNLPANAGDTGDAGSIPGLERSPGGGNGNPLQYLAWRVQWTEEPGGLQSMGLQESDATEATYHACMLIPLWVQWYSPKLYLREDPWGKRPAWDHHVESGNQSALELTPTLGPRQEASLMSPSLGVALALGRDGFLRISLEGGAAEFPYGEKFKVKSGGRPLPGQHSETQAPSSRGGTAHWWLMLTPSGDTGTSRSLTWRTVQPLPARRAASVFSDSSMPLFSCVLPSVSLRRSC